MTLDNLRKQKDGTHAESAIQYISILAYLTKPRRGLRVPRENGMPIDINEGQNKEDKHESPPVL
jgi:hypothetical protein